MRYTVVIETLLSFVLTDKESVKVVVTACVEQGISVAVEASGDEF